jgi:hypothetical protein
MGNRNRAIRSRDIDQGKDGDGAKAGDELSEGVWFFHDAIVRHGCSG